MAAAGPRYEKVSYYALFGVDGIVLVYGEMLKHGAIDRDRILLAQAALRNHVRLSGEEGDTLRQCLWQSPILLAGHNLCEGILAGLVRRSVTGRGGLVETSLIEALLDFQFEVITTHLNDGRRPHWRSAYRNAHAYLAAPYGVYDTQNGYLALAMTHLPTLGKLLDLPALQLMSDQADGFRRRDEIKRIIAVRLKERTTQHWLEILNAADIWCAEVLDWPELFASQAFEQLAMIQTLKDERGIEILTTRLPIRLDGGLLTSERLAPRVGQHTEQSRENLGFSSTGTRERHCRGTTFSG